ncbi:hypothetical protein BV898_14697 [Hypsibius exemplaris]|uniref:Uncharacterized protein n=1 Tax=Hypsibius exemplaris TaxID=2072580 RepID=A0A9X6N9D9_HYPEX|nr:hypothetical protein BV898_14697 [Hypsibius exemplaris]
MTFLLWRNKDPYIFLHIALAMSSLPVGISASARMALRYTPFTEAFHNLQRVVGLAVILSGSGATMLANLTASLDRWCSGSPSSGIAVPSCCKTFSSLSLKWFMEVSSS